jgi:hypothetical protein
MNNVWWMTAIRENVVTKDAQPMHQVPEYVLTPSPVIEIVCDADHWTKVRAKGGTLRENQHAIQVNWLQFMPYVTAEKDPTLPRVVI